MLHYGCNLLLVALETMDEYYGQKQRASRKVRPVFGLQKSYPVRIQPRMATSE